MNKNLNIAPERLTKIRIVVLALLLTGNTLALVVEFFSATRADHYFVAHEDEVIYFNSAKLFEETGSLGAEGCINEDVSPIGQMNWYGPGYNFIYGSVRKLFGHSNSLFINFHMVLALALLVIILILPDGLEANLLAANVFLMTEQFSSYIFSYFPEILHLFFSALLIFILILIYRKEEKNTNSLVILYVSLIVLFTLCRVTTIFWLAGILPLGTNWRERRLYITVFIIGVIGAVIYLRFFIAPPYAGEMHKLQSLYKFDLLDFILKTGYAALKNAYNIIVSNSKPVYLLIVIGLVTMIFYLKSKDKFLLASVLISVCLVGVLMAYYTVSPFYFVKQTAMLLPLLMVAVMRIPNLFVKYTILLVMITLFWVPTNKLRSKNIQEHQQAYVNLENNRSIEKELDKIRTAVESNRSHVILWCYNEYDFGNTLEAVLPFSSSTRYPIMYTTNVVFDHSIPLEEKFKFHNKLEVGYVLSRNKIDWSSLQEIFHSSFFYFYKVKK